MVNTNYENLYAKLCQSRNMLKLQYRDEAKIALVNYMENLNEALYEMGADIIDEIDIYEGCEDSYHLYCKEMRKKDILFVNRIMNYQEFHQELFGTLLNEFRNQIPENSPYTLNRSLISKKDFADILFQFLQEIHLEKEFEKIIKEKRIHSVKDGFQSLGFFIYNPITSDSDIFVEGFQYDFAHMYTLVHEIGHYFEITKSFNSIDDYNQYFYMSCNTEVISLLMERLFQKFLIKNHIEEKEVKNQVYEFLKLSYDLIGTAYVYSLINKEYVNRDIPKKEIEKLLKMNNNSTIPKKELLSFLGHIYDYSFTSTYQYVYGDIISLVLSEEVEEKGLSNTLMDSYYRKRHYPFSLDFLEENEINAEKCIKIYQKELKLLQK